jgi:hypothetical protein
LVRLWFIVLLATIVAILYFMGIISITPFLHLRLRPVHYMREVLEAWREYGHNVYEIDTDQSEDQIFAGAEKAIKNEESQNYE